MTARFGVPAWARLGVAAALAAVALAGCSGAEPDPTPTTPATASTVSGSPTQSPTVSPEPTETAALPLLPEEAKENTPAGAEAFIRYYFDVANDLYMTPIPGIIPGLSDAGCVSCQRTEETIADLAETKSRARAQPFKVAAMEPLGGGEPGVQRFNMVVEAPANATVSESGSESNVGEASTLTGIGAAVWGGERWRLFDLELSSD